MILPSLLPTVLFGDPLGPHCPIVEVYPGDVPLTLDPIGYTRAGVAFDTLEPDGPTWS